MSSSQFSTTKQKHFYEQQHLRLKTTLYIRNPTCVSHANGKIQLQDLSSVGASPVQWSVTIGQPLVSSCFEAPAGQLSSDESPSRPSTSYEESPVR